MDEKRVARFHGVAAAIRLDAPLVGAAVLEMAGLPAMRAAHEPGGDLVGNRIEGRPVLMPGGGLGGARFLHQQVAVEGVVHKADAGGVYLGVADEAALLAACASLAKLGPDMCVAPMVPRGVEIAFGMVNDPHLGPVVMVGAGGTLVELIGDRAHALAPFGSVEAGRLIDEMNIRRVLERTGADAGTLHFTRLVAAGLMGDSGLATGAGKD